MAGGAHPKDAELFSSHTAPSMELACEELSWLLSRGYTLESSLALVGNRHALVHRQRLALSRIAMSDAARSRRREGRLSLETLHLSARALAIDAFNVVVGVENVLRGGVVLVGRDGAWRDMASMHGNYRTSEQTELALQRIAAVLIAGSATINRPTTWYLDAPVSNSGRLAAMIRDMSARLGADWEVELVADADPCLAASGAVVASADGWILDRAPAWVDLVEASVHDVAQWRVEIC